MWEWLMSIFGGDSGGGAGGAGGGGSKGGGEGASWTSIFKDSGGGGGGQGGHTGSGLDQTAQASQAGMSSQAQLGSVLGQAPQGGFDVSADAGNSWNNILKQLLAGKGSISNMRKGEDVREQVLGDLYGVNNLNRMR